MLRTIRDYAIDSTRKSKSRLLAIAEQDCIRGKTVGTAGFDSLLLEAKLN